MKPIIGITTAWSVETWNDPIETRGYNYVGTTYIEAIVKAGGIPILLPQFDFEDIHNIIDMVDGILFSGGGNAKIALKEDLPTLREQQPRRYDFELELMKVAQKRKIPMLGICRGLQMMIEAFGGELSSEIIEGHRQSLHGGEPWHKIKITESSLLHEMVNELEWDVNSYHVQKVVKMPDSFTISAITNDEVVEVIESKEDKFTVGIQFHPEELLLRDKRAELIFGRFIEICNHKNTKSKEKNK